MNRVTSASVHCKNEAALLSAAELLLQTFPSQKFFALYGEMGAGKTTFVKSFCTLLKCIDVVNSPTFSIVNIYKTELLTEVYHFDFYRIKSIEEVFDIGYEDYFYNDCYCFAEWPEKVESLLPENAVKIYIEVNPDGSRTIIF
jgi:tRNA threonylcarbamoyladenosine biosynthesis protein TsaE